MLKKIYRVISIFLGTMVTIGFYNILDDVAYEAALASTSIFIRFAIWLSVVVGSVLIGALVIFSLSFLVNDILDKSRK